jgi:uncharacterized protein (DUF433 family)
MLPYRWPALSCWRLVRSFALQSCHPILNGELQAASSTPLAEVTLDYSQIITIEPGKRSGKPCIRGMRMTVYDVLGYMAAGMSHQEILADFPSLTETDIRACLAFAIRANNQS